MWRVELARGSLPTDQDIDLHKEDRVDILDAMLAEMADEGADEDGTVGTLRAEAAPKGRDLWPFARTPSYYKELLCSLGAADKATAAVVMSTTPHPSHWLACLNLGLDTIVFTARWSDHCKGHGIHLAKQILNANHSTDLALQLRPSVQTPSEAQCQFFIEAAVKNAEEQIVEAYDVSQGCEWHDGLNRILPSLTASSQKQVRAESESNGLRITGQTDIGRGLETLSARREGDILCNASALFFDTHDDLVALLCIPGNERFADRVCKIKGVLRREEPVVIWAVLLGVAQYIQDFTQIRHRANVVLEFDPTRGFNSDSLKVVVRSRNISGIAAGTQILLGYGPSFSVELPRGKNTDNHRGSLDVLFESQKARLPLQALQHVVRMHGHPACRAMSLDSEGISRLVQANFTK
jgi:hypothetical protein